MAKAGVEVSAFKPRRVSAGWRKHKRTCGLCAGAGMVGSVACRATTAVCSGCNGRGYVAEWTRTGGVSAKQR